MIEFTNFVLTKEGQNMISDVLSTNSFIHLSFIATGSTELDITDLSKYDQSTEKQYSRIREYNLKYNNGEFILDITLQNDGTNKNLDNSTSYELKYIILKASKETSDTDKWKSNKGIPFAIAKPKSECIIPAYNGITPHKLHIKSKIVLDEIIKAPSPNDLLTLKDASNTLERIVPKIATKYVMDKYMTNVGKLSKYIKTYHGFGAGLPPDAMKKVVFIPDDITGKISLEFPDDTIIDGHRLCKVAGVKIIEKLGKYPVNENDGRIVGVIERKDFAKYKNKLWEGINGGPEVYKNRYTVFPYSDRNIYSRNPKNNAIIGEIYGYDININDSNPNTRVSYPSDVLNKNYRPFRIGLSTGEYTLNEWRDAFFIKEIRPVMLKYNGEVDYELNHDDHSKKLDGAISDIRNRNYEGNTMIEFPKMYFKRWEDTTHQHVRVANYKVDDDYKCYQHMYDGKELDKIYIGMFAPCEVNGRIRSLADELPLVGKRGSEEKALIDANGPGWQYDDWMNTCMVVDLLFLMGKSTDLQGTFGMGNCSNTFRNITGQTLDKGMFNGRDDSKKSVKFFYLENYYGDTYNRKYGCISNNNKDILIKPYPPYSTDTNNPPGYINVVKYNGSVTGYISKTKMSEYGMIPIEAKGSDSTYIPDYCNSEDRNMAFNWGGSYISNKKCGAYFSLSDFASAFTDCSPSLCYKKPL